MAKKNNNMLIIGAIIVGFLIFSKGDISFLGALSGDETMTRTGTNAVDAGDPFQITYTAIGASGQWGASIEDSVSGGCTFPSGGTAIQTVMLSEDGLSKTITMSSPNIDTVCTFSGDYKFGNFPIVNLNPYSVTISTCTPDCSAAGTYCTGQTFSDGCGGICNGVENPVCTRPGNLCIESSSVSNNCLMSGGSFGNCAGEWVVTTNTNADTNCDGIVNRAELGVAIILWINNNPIMDRTELGQAIMAWVGG